MGLRRSNAGGHFAAGSRSSGESFSAQSWRSVQQWSATPLRAVRERSPWRLAEDTALRQFAEIGWIHHCNTRGRVSAIIRVPVLSQMPMSWRV
jgi:hypothetical protein